MIMTETTFLWHDYETFGANPRFDRPCQFAYLRTNVNLEPIESPSIIYCQPTLDVLPHPTACLITGITPQYAQDHGDPEPRFAQQIFDVMSRPNTCCVGYNSLRFDDEVTRHLFWRNFLSPYQREFANGNSRFDLINVLRLTRALRPEGLAWADYADGRPSFRLEDLAKVNGLDIDCAHDALVDVENTLGLAQLVKQHQPKLWDWALKLRDKHFVDGLLRQQAPLFYATSVFARHPGSVSPIMPLEPHPTASGQWLAWNLRVDPEPFWAMNEEEFIQMSSQARDEDTGGMPYPLVSIKTNACPMLAPLNVAEASILESLEIDLDVIERIAKQLSQHSDRVHAWARWHAERQPQWDTSPDPETSLYTAFIPRADQSMVNKIPSMVGEELTELDSPFIDERLNELLVRYRARHWPDSLDRESTAHWQEAQRQKLTGEAHNPGLTLAAYDEAIDVMEQEHPEQSELVLALRTWSQTVRSRFAFADPNSST